MKEFLIKIAILAVIVIAIVVLVKKFSSPSEEPENKSFQEVIAEDDRRLRADVEEPQETESALEQSSQQLKQTKVAQEQAEQMPAEDQVQVQRLFEMALAQRKMARLPGIGYKQMIDYCREIIQKYPNSPEAPKARRMLGEVPERYRELYNITDEEMGL